MEINLILNHWVKIIDRHPLDNNKNTGIWFYDQEVFSLENDELKSYKFQVNLSSKISNYCEHLKFIHTCRLSDYIIDDNVNWEKLINECALEEAYESVNRILRFEENIIPEIKLYSDNNFKDCEFLEFDGAEQNTEFWEPFTFKEQKGFLLDKYEPVFSNQYPILDVARNFQFYDIPYSIRGVVYKKVVQDEKVNKPVDEISFLLGRCFHFLHSNKKYELFYSLSETDKASIARNYFSRMLGDSLIIEAIKPYSLSIFKNDYQSFIKYFTTEEEVQEEIQYLRKMQPLNMNKDIINRDYLFDI